MAMVGALVTDDREKKSIDSGLKIKDEVCL
jgi:hypothetical protein